MQFNRNNIAATLRNFMVMLWSPSSNMTASIRQEKKQNEALKLILYILVLVHFGLFMSTTLVCVLGEAQKANFLSNLIS